MLIQIETDQLVKEKLTPNNFIILKLLHESNYELLKELYYDSIKLTEDLIFLESQGYLKITDENLSWNIISTQIFIRQKTKDLFEVKESGFYKFWSIYPLKVGSRVLRAKDYNSREGLICKQKWDRITHKNPVKEAEIIKALELEIEIKRNSNSLQYMQLITTYLNQQTWEKYTHLINNTEAIETNEKTELL